MDHAVWYTDLSQFPRPYFLLDNVPPRKADGDMSTLKDYVIRPVLVLEVSAFDGRIVFGLERLERVSRELAPNRNSLRNFS